MHKTFLRLALCASLLGATALPAAAQSTAGAYLAARSATFASDFETASRYFTRLLRAAPEDTYILENVIFTNISLGRFDTAIPVARRLNALDTASQFANLALFVDQARKENYDQLADMIAGEEGVGPLLDGLAAGWVALGQGDMTQALAKFDQVAEQQGLKGFALFHKALALASVGDFEGAENIYAGDAAASTMQITRRSALAHMEILSQLGRNEDAINILDALFGTELSPQVKKIRASLIAGESLPFTQVNGPRDGIAEVFFGIGSALLSEDASDHALMYARSAQYLRPDHVDSILLAASVLEEIGQYDLATQTYQAVPPEAPNFHAAELGRAEAMRRAGKMEAAIEVLNQLSRTHGDLPVVHSTLGDFLRAEKEFETAAAAYDTALTLLGDDADSEWFIYYARAVCHERLGNWPQAEADFRKSLAINPGQPQVMNYLGYSLVEKQTNLDEALAMIQEAVAARPNAGHIVDSLGWVLYRLGRFDEAVGHMERAAELMPIDPVVNDHLGDVYWAVGRFTEAEFQWNRALSFVTEESYLEAKPDRIRRKLDVGLDQVLVEEGAAPLQMANDG